MRLKLTFKWEGIDQLLADGFEELALEHWQIVSSDKELVPLDQDWESYRLFERKGLWTCLAARLGKRLVGYNCFYIVKPLQYKSTSQVMNHGIYLSQDLTALTRTWGYVRLMREAEKDLMAGGVIKISYHGKLDDLSLDALMKRCGYTKREEVYAKVKG